MRGLAAALVVLATAAALPSAAAGAWSAPRTVATPRDSGDLDLAFNARGDTLLTAHADTGGFTSLRPAGGRFGAPRAYRTKDSFNAPTAVLDMDRSALLVGDWYHQAPELEDPESRDECCYRVYAMPLSRGGRAGRARMLTPYGVDSALLRVATDERGRAGIAFRRDGTLFAAVRRPDGQVGSPRRIGFREGLYPELTVRPDGRGVAWWHDQEERIRYAAVGRGGMLGPQRTAFQAPARHTAGPLDLVFGRRGHGWLTWRVTARRRDALDVLYAARRGADGSFGSVRRIGASHGFLGAAVDDAGNLTAVLEDRAGLVSRFVGRGGRAGPLRRLAREGGIESPRVLAGPGGTAVVGWERVRRVGRGAYQREVRAAAGRNGRFGPARTAVSASSGHSISYLVWGMTPRGAAVAAWNDSPVRGPARTRIRYSVLAP